MPSASRERVLAAVSGGVDSSVAALLAQRQGLEVAALTLSVPGTDTEAAAMLARRLGIEHHVADVQALLEEKVIGPFLEETGWTVRG